MTHRLLAGLALVLAAPLASAQTPCVDGKSAPTDDTSPAAAVGPFDCGEVDLLGFVPISVFGSSRANDIWGWTDPESGHEYALMGLDDGTGFVDITKPSAPVVLGKLPTATTATVWRDIKVYKDFAFIVSEARDHGMQVFNLAHLRGLTEDASRRFEADVLYTKITNAHNIVINEDTGFAYAVGAGTRMDDMPADCASSGFHVINIANPMQPEFAGCFSDARKERGAVSSPGYTHDAQCIVYDGPDADYIGHEVCVGSNEDVVTFFDVSDKSDVRIISTAAYPLDAYTHQGWFTEDRRFFLANDELDEQNGYVDTQRTLIFDVSNLDEPEFLYAYDSGITTIDHNMYVRGNYAFASNYESGLRILDISDIANENIREVGFFDTYPAATTVNFSGQWSNYPYFESGVVIANDINHGLFILQPTVTRRATGSLHR